MLLKKNNSGKILSFKALTYTGLIFILVFSCYACSDKPPAITKENSAGAEAVIPAIAITKDLPWSERMARSIMKRAPEAWMNDFQEKPRWNYTLGLVLNAIMEVGEAKNNPIYFNYAKAYGDTMIYADGSIRDYDIANFNIDHVAPGPLMLALYHKTGEEKYRTAIETLHQQLTWQPQHN